MMVADRPTRAGDEITFEMATGLMLRELEEIGRKADRPRQLPPDDGSVLVDAAFG
jgi:hypothetical protein